MHTTNNNLQLKARKLVADVIDSALIGGWILSEDNNEDRLLSEEVRKIEADLRKIILPFVSNLCDSALCEQCNP